MLDMGAAEIQISLEIHRESRDNPTSGSIPTKMYPNEKPIIQPTGGSTLAILGLHEGM